MKTPTLEDTLLALSFVALAGVVICLGLAWWFG